MKKGKSEFTPEEEERIIILLSILRDATREKQKQIRRKLRKNYGFYISNFTSSKKGFTKTDFEDLKKKRVVTIRNG